MSGMIHNHNSRAFLALQVSQQKEEEDLKETSVFLWVGRCKISLHKQEGLDWKADKKNVRANHKVVNPQTEGEERRNTASDLSVCGCNVCGLDEKQALSETGRGEVRVAGEICLVIRANRKLRL